MSTDAPATAQSADKGSAPATISPAERKQLQKLFEMATQKYQEGIKKGLKTNFDYANDLFSQCVLRDPGNVHYLKALLDNLYQKFGERKQVGRFASWFGGSGSKAALKKLSGKGDVTAVIKAGLGYLKNNPYDADAFVAMAEACEKARLHDVQLLYLKGARRAAPKDAAVNRTCAHALTRRGRFDDAIECWRRVKEAHPDDEEADQMIAKLAVDKTIKHGNYEEAESTTDTMADKQAKAERKGEAEKVTPEQRLRKLIQENPGELGPYLELAELYTNEDRLLEAEAILQQALPVSGGDVKVREYLEDAQMRRVKGQVRVAEKRALEEKTEDAKSLHQNLLAELNNLETQIYASRVERYPANTALKYELGARLRRAGNYTEAIKVLQQARNDIKRKGLANLELGDCFRMIKQYPLAVQAYEAALEALGPKDVEPRKLAMYWAGKIALAATKDLERAEKHLNALAGIDFNYKDLAALLDKLAEMRNTA